MEGVYGLIRLTYKALLTAGVGVASLPGAHQLLQSGLRPTVPSTAYLNGEELVGQPRRVLAITCHPDDLAFFCGGTLARLSMSGSHIHALVLTDGEKGGNQPDLGLRRRQEKRRVGKVLGFDDITFCGLPDYGLEYEPRLLPTLERAIRSLEPEVVLGFDPKELVPGMVNRDHQALGMALLELAGQPFLTATRMYYYGTRHPNVLVDISGILARKVDAVMQHQSQLQYLPKPLYPHLVRLYGSLAGAGFTSYAEGLFRLV